MIIQNADTLGTTPLRRDALQILDAGYTAIMTTSAIRSQFRLEGETLKITSAAGVDGKTREVEIYLPQYRRVLVVAIGKCAFDAGKEIEEILGDRITAGVVLDVRGGVLKYLRSEIGTHPFPSEKNKEVTESIVAMLKDTTAEDLILAVISGGGSSLLCLPHDIKCEKLTEITKQLMEKGADIHELNTVRKHLSEVQGGNLAKLAYPAKVVSLIFSDVAGNDIATIASGPTVMDTTVAMDAAEILSKYDIMKLCELPHCEILETPKEGKYFENVENILFVTNDAALFAMGKKAEELGYAPVICSNCATGEAGEFGKKLASEKYVGKGCSLYGGETTVTVAHSEGKGGRNQEVVLGALPYLPENTVIIAAASDGWDNTEVAGALGDKTLYEESKSLGVNTEEYTHGRSYEFFSKVGDGHITTDRTGANVADFYFVLTQ